jgi:hypothetical protein
MSIHLIKVCDSEWVSVLNDDPVGSQKTCDLSGQMFVYLGDCLMLWFRHTDQCDKVSMIAREVQYTMKLVTIARAHSFIMNGVKDMESPVTESIYCMYIQRRNHLRISS